MSESTEDIPASMYTSVIPIDQVLFLGTFLSMIVLGFTVAQAYWYFRCYPCDKVWLKSLVGILLTLSFIHTTFSINSVYHYFIINHANFDAMIQIKWSIKAVIAIPIFVAFTTNCVQIWRVYVIGGSSRIAGAALLFVLMEFSLTFVLCVIVAVKIKDCFNFLQYNTLLILVFSSWVAADIAVAGTMIWCLRKHRSGLRRTMSLLNTLIAYAISSGLIFVAFSVSSLICAIVFNDQAIFIGMFILEKFYLNYLLASLNSRKELNASFEENAGNFSLFNDNHPRSTINIGSGGITFA